MEMRILPGMTIWRAVEIAVFLIILAAWFYSIQYFGISGNVQIALYFIVFLVVEIAARAAVRHFESRSWIGPRLP